MDDDQRQFETDLLESVRQMTNSKNATVRRAQANAKGCDTVVLRVHKLHSGQWAGRVYDAHGQEVGKIVDCRSPEDAEVTAIGQGHQITHVVVST